MTSTQRACFWVAAGAALVAGLALRIHDASVWNPYWGYDGGAHVAYAATLALEARLPTLAETYVAWHEPLFYLLAAPVYRLVGGGPAALRVLPAIPTTVGALTLFFLGWWCWRRSRRPDAVAVALLLAAGLPVAVAASTFFSNEGLAQLLMLAALAAVALARRPDEAAATNGAGVLLGLALLTKLSAFIALAAILVWHGWRAVASVRAVPLRALAGTLALAVGISLPWFAYRVQAFGGVINNPVEERAAWSALPSGFFSSLDRNVFFSPFWPAGSDSFWSVTFAGAVTDYDALLHDPDRSRLAPVRVAVGEGRVVSRAHADAARRAVFLGAILAPLFLLAWTRLARRVWRERRRPGADALLLAFLGGSLAALAVNLLRWGSLERGNLKPLFILSAVLVSVMLVAETVTDPAQHPRLRRALTAYAFAGGAFFAANGILLTWV